MAKRLYICFDNKEEILCNGENKPIGNLLFTFLDSEIYKLKNLIDNTQERLEKLSFDKNSQLSLDKIDEKPYFIFANTYKLIIKRLEAFHPIFAYCFDIYLERILDKKYGENDIVPVFTNNIVRHFPSDKMDVETVANFVGNDDSRLIKVTNELIEGALQFFDQIAEFRADLLHLIEQILDRDGENPKLKPIQRFYEQQSSDNQVIRKYSWLRDKIRVDYRLSGEDNRLKPQIFYSAEDLRALIFLEFKYMAINNISVKKCEFCGRYFLPFSKNSLYCDRISDGFYKTCKQVAPNLKRNEKISKDKAAQLYNKFNNRYCGRRRRGDRRMTDKLLTDWRTYAKNLKKQYNAGKISIDDFIWLIDMTEWQKDRTFAEQRAGMR